MDYLSASGTLAHTNPQNIIVRNMEVSAFETPTVEINKYGTPPTPSIIARASRGTAAAPVNVANGDRLYSFTKFRRLGGSFEAYEEELNVQEAAKLLKGNISEFTEVNEIHYSAFNANPVLHEVLKNYARGGIQGGAENIDVNDVLERVIYTGRLADVNTTFLTEQLSYGGANTYVKQYSLAGSASSFNWVVNNVAQMELIAGVLKPATHDTLDLATNADRIKHIYTVNITSTNALVIASDARLKSNVTNIDNTALDFLCDLRPVQYNKVGNKNVEFGLIAQELEEITAHYDLGDSGIVVKPEKENEYYGVAYEQFIPILIKAVQQLRQEIDTINFKIE